MNSDNWQRRPTSVGSNNVSWPTKIRGAIQVGHGLGDAIRGSLGATDIQRNNYTSSDEIAQRGRHEIAQGLARIRGMPAALPPAPVYDRRHSHPVQQYDPEPTPFWRARSASAQASQRQPVNPANPSTASQPFEKYYEHPYLAEHDQDPGFAGLGAGMDPSMRKDPVRPVFLTHQPPPAPVMDTPPYPSIAARRNLANSNSAQAWSAATGVSPSSSEYPHHAPLREQQQPQATPEPPSNHRDRRRRSLSMMLNRTRKSMLGGKGKGKGRGKGKGATATHEDLDDGEFYDARATQSAPATPPPLARPAHQHESTLETAGYDVLSYDTKDVYPHWPSETEMRNGMSMSSGSGRQESNNNRRAVGGRLEPVRSVHGR
ncbi:hypothetical protein C8F01DRAFT_1149584 [Mycena amicta]|nr:hypothetical protein C8F01DRAFT_1149584 [Mycena amicta]